MARPPLGGAGPRALSARAGGRASRGRDRRHSLPALQTSRSGGLHAPRGLRGAAARRRADPHSCDRPRIDGADRAPAWPEGDRDTRSEEHTSELQSLMRISYAVFCLKKKKIDTNIHNIHSIPSKKRK